MASVDTDRAEALRHEALTVLQETADSKDVLKVLGDHRSHDLLYCEVIMTTKPICVSVSLLVKQRGAGAARCGRLLALAAESFDSALRNDPLTPSASAGDPTLVQCNVSIDDCFHRYSDQGQATRGSTQVL